MGFREIHGISGFHRGIFWDIRYLFGDFRISPEIPRYRGFNRMVLGDFTQEIPQFPGDVRKKTHHSFTFMRIQWDYENYED